MNSNNCSNDSESMREFLRQLEEQSNTVMTPAVVMLVIFAVVGLAGNILVLMVYSQKVRLNPTKVLIMSIASFDLVANTGAIPTAIITMLDTWNFSRPVLCKVTASMGAFTAIGGAFCLLTVAVTRYRRVCRPYGWQVTIKHAIIASLLSFLLALVFSSPYMVIYGVRTRETQCLNIQGHDCFVDDSFTTTMWPLLNNVVFVLLYLVLGICFFALYTSIGVMAWKHRKFHGISGESTKITINSNSTSQPSSSVTAPLRSSADTPANKQADAAPLTSHGSMTSLLTRSHNGTIEKPTKHSHPSIATKSISTVTAATADKPTSAATTTSLIIKTKEKKSHLPSSLLSPTKQFICTPRIDHCLHLESTYPVSQTSSTQSTSDETGQEKERSSLKASANYGDIHHKPHLQINMPTRDSNRNRCSRAKQAASGPRDPAKIGKNRLSLGKMTAMLIIISAIYILGFLPFLILTVYKSQLPERYATLNQVQLTVFNLFYRLYFLQSATNPIVYSFCDGNFRRNCIQLLTCKLIRHS